MRTYKNLFFSIASGILLWLSWPVSPLTFFIFFAFVPLLILEHNVKTQLSFLGWTYLTLLIWNVGSTWWICNSTVPGGVAAIVLNSLLMCIPWISFYVVKKRKGPNAGYFSLLLFWMTFEYIHLNWELSWPWLTIGNVFASRPEWIQWYEYTGSSGGTFWVMLLNILIARFIIEHQFHGKNPIKWKNAAIILFTLLIPLLVSVVILHNRQQSFRNGPANTSTNVVVVQPNIDPYMKFEAGMQQGQLQTMMQLSKSQVDSSTTLLVWPETALNLPTGIDLDRINEQPYLTPLHHFLASHPNLTLLSGIEGLRYFTGENKGETARAIPGSNYYYETYNAAVIMTTVGARQFYYKSKLVPGVETLPSFLNLLSRWFEQFGGTGSGYTGQKERTVLKDQANRYQIAPAICYESIFGEFLTGYTRNGANVICIITNDGWWANTSGHKQHLQYARLRAIENRRWIARSANTGISAFVSPVGEILKPEPWDKAAAIKMNLPMLSGMTFFSKYGDIISKICTGITVLLLVSFFLTWVRRKF